MSNPRNKRQPDNQAILSALAALPDELKCIIDAYLPFSAKANLALTCRANFSFFNPRIIKKIDPLFSNASSLYHPYVRFHRKRVQKFLNHVVYGEQEEAETMLKRDIGLLLAIGTVEDYSGRVVEGTALRLALGAEDVRYHKNEECMAEMIQRYLMKLPNGNEIMAQQVSEQFPHDWEKVEEARVKRDTEALRNVFTAIAESKEGDNCTAAIQAFINYLNQENKGKGVIKTGKHFNHALLVNAFELYNANFSKFGGYDSPKNNLVWRRVIGNIERHVPAATAQAICQSSYFIVHVGEKLNRSLKFRYENVYFYPLDLNPAFRLGDEYAAWMGIRVAQTSSCIVTRATSLSAGPWRPHLGLAELCRAKNNGVLRFTPQRANSLKIQCTIV